MRFGRNLARKAKGETHTRATPRLKKYRRRNFTKTPEPEGSVHSTESGYLFVVQKHRARRLHFDFRLEMNGVLKSWAIPKGPSLDPAEKRLAVHVEDHPVEYGSFEGTIPRGEYGGGPVMIWDRGAWEPVGDPEKDYRKGRLKFYLHGKRLHGLWTLAQMKGRAGEEGKNWLLIKHRDDEALSGDEAEIVESEKSSIVSERSMDEIAGDEGEAIWHSAGFEEEKDEAVLRQKEETRRGMAEISDPSGVKNAKAGKQPKKMKPQLAILAKEAPSGNEWIHEIKLDGYRIMSFIEGGKVRLVSRKGKNWTDKFSAIAGSLRKFPCKEAVLDGEIVVLRDDGTSDFQALQNVLKGIGTGRLVYYLFDIPHCGGYDLTGSPLLDRKDLLRSLLQYTTSGGGAIRFSDHIAGSGPEVYRKACRMALEGIVSKYGESGYVEKRSPKWIKVKCMKRQEFVIGGYTEPSGSRKGFGALILGYYENGTLVYAGRTGTGFTEKTLGLLETKLKDIETEKTPFYNAPAGANTRGVHWVRPELVCEIEFSGWTEDKILRQSSFKGLREDKSPEEVVREYPRERSGGRKESAENERPLKTGSKRKPSDVFVAGVKISNPDKTLYSEQGVTKRELALFYEKIAGHILPHIIRRPLTVVRCPEGRQRGCFYQKHVKTSTPDAIRSIPIEEKKTVRNYIIIDDIKGLITLAQMGVLEIHPWGSSEVNIESPDILTFDLDPGPGLAWGDVVEGARFIRERLQDLGLRIFLKTSGGKGLHLVIPIERRTGWDEAKAFTKAVAQDAVRLRPDRFVSVMSKEKRKGKIFIDYLRNGRGATSVAAYSSRARPGATVSAPVSWEELYGKKIRPDSFTVRNIPGRLASLKQDPWIDYFDTRQRITNSMKKEVGMK
ncbi:MAG: DNA ligase D [Syntrophales bacterium]|nr:DNA ligase D [Syntrophales bacterium]